MVISNRSKAFLRNQLFDAANLGCECGRGEWGNRRKVGNFEAILRRASPAERRIRGLFTPPDVAPTGPGGEIPLCAPRPARYVAAPKGGFEKGTKTFAAGFGTPASFRSRFSGEPP